MSDRPLRRALARLGCAALCLFAPGEAFALAIWNAATPADVAARRDEWLAAIGGAPQFVVDFESGFAPGTPIEGQTLPGGLVIRDAAATGSPTVEGAGSAKLGGSLPIGTLALAAGSSHLVLDFSAAPVDYVAFRDVDLAGTSASEPNGGWIFPIAGNLGSIVVLDRTADAGASAEFFGFAGAQIVSITIQGGGNLPDLEWGIDDLAYGRFAVPEPGVAALVAGGLAGLAVHRAHGRRRA